jgi:hypothetical protein
MALTRDEAAVVKGMLARGDKQHHIAAFFGINSGRIADINTGKKWADVTAAPSKQLPPPGPYMTARSAHLAKQTLELLRDDVENALIQISNWEEAVRDERD